MIKDEKLSIKKAHKRVNENLKALLQTKHTIKDIFEISFSHKNFTLFNLVKWNTLTEITYGEAYKKVKAFSAEFSKSISKDEKYVGILLENSPEWIYSLYGLLMAGFTPVLLSTKASEESNKEILDSLKSSTIVTNISNRNKYSKVINPFEIQDNAEEVKENWSNEIVFITSGTSGKSKIILYTGEELCEQIVNATGILKNYPSIASTYNGYLKHLMILPLYHVFGFIAVFLWFSFFNTTFVIPSSLASNKIREACMIGEPTHIFAVPLFWDTITKSVEHVVHQKKAEKKFNKGINASLKIQKLMKKKGPNFVKNKLFASYLDNIFGKSIQFCISGGSYISKNTLRVINGLGYPLVNGFGSTEIGISSFADPKHVANRLDNSIGKPFDTFEYQIGENNELLVKGKSTYNSILENGEFIKREKSEFIHTQDSVKKFKKVYYITGRMDEIFVDQNGENYSLPKVEQEFRTSFALDVVALPAKDAKSIAILVSFAEKCSDYQIKYDIGNIIKSEAFIRNNIKEIYLVRHEIEKANGIKIKRNLLRQMLEKNDEFELVNLDDYKDSKNELLVDDKLLEIVIEKFKTITHAENVTKNSDFFLDLGGDSLTYYELIGTLEGYFGIKFNFEEGLNRTPIQFVVTIMEKI